MRVLCDAYLVNEKAVLSSYRDQAQTGKLVIARKVYIEIKLKVFAPWFAQASDGSLARAFSRSKMCQRECRYSFAALALDTKFTHFLRQSLLERDH